MSSTVEPGFEAVRDAFQENFVSRGDAGAAVAVYKDGRPVVDLVGGDYKPDSVQFVFSATKGITAMCVSRLADSGVIDINAPVANYWPEFAANGKERITIRHVLGHQAGLHVLDAQLSLDDLLKSEPIEAAIEAQRPAWEPGTALSYHALTYGWILGGVVRRADGRSIGRYFREEIAEPLGLDTWIGIPPEVEPRVVPLIDMPKPRVRDFLGLLRHPRAIPRLVTIMRALADPNSPANRAVYMNGALRATGDAMVWNRADVHGAEWPAGNGITDARSLARLYAACIGEVDGFRVLSAEASERARTEVSSGTDLTTTMPGRFGLGFSLPLETAPLLGAGSFGHGGMGGSLAFADPETGVGFAYVMNQMRLEPGRATALVDALRSCLSSR